MKMLLVLAPAIGLAVDVAGHLGVTWILPLRNLYARMACGTVAGLVAVVALSLFASTRLALEPITATVFVLFNMLTFVVLAFGYLNLVQMNLSSLRLRVAHELIDAPEGMPVGELFAKYDGRAIVDARLARLSSGRQIVLRDGRYYRRLSVVYLIAVAMDTMKRVVFRRRIRDSFGKARRS